MKYMGSKRVMLGNGLGDLLDRELTSAKRFVDLFAGSGVVSIYVAQKKSIPVHAIDIQSYGAVLVGAVISRDRRFRWRHSWDAWVKRAKAERKKYRVPDSAEITQKIIRNIRRRCEKARTPVMRAYGGHYFSPNQAVWIDALRATLPKREPGRNIALAALIRAASQCAAAPGHTAQPFQPTRRAKKFLCEAWSRDVLTKTKHAFGFLADVYAQRRGSAAVDDANRAAKKLKKTDIAFIDPPYSGVHYSRFYHVLETIARGDCGEVNGVGRYPPVEERPWSRYSVTTEARKALDELFKIVSARAARTIVTFPVHRCSNGLSGRIVRNLAKKYFEIAEQKVRSRLSSLGGAGKNGHGAASRAARVRAKELILVLTPTDNRANKR
jgi:adenine-specific DNA-methyltransferase